MIQLLKVRVSPETMLDLLQGRLGRDLSEHLAEIPTDVDLSDERARVLIDKDGHADRAWRRLVRTTGTSQESFCPQAPQAHSRIRHGRLVRVRDQPRILTLAARPTDIRQGVLADRLFGAAGSGEGADRDRDRTRS